MSWLESSGQVCFTSVDGQVQPLDVALGHSVLQKLCDSNAKLGNISLAWSILWSHSSVANILANGALR
jgi:hypothetical protein